MRDVVLILMVLATIPFILRNPYYGLLSWAWVSYMVPHKLTWGFAANFPVAQLIGGVFLISFVLSKHKKAIPINSISILLIVFNLWILFVTVVTPGSLYESMQIEKVLKIQLVNFITLSLLYSEKRIKYFIAVIAFSVGFYGIKGGIFTITSGGGERVWGPPGGFFEGNNELALTLLMIIPMFFFMAKNFEPIASRKWARLATYVAIGLIAIAAIGSQSRGAMLASCAVLFFLWLKSNKKFVTGIIAVIAVVSVYSFMPQSWHDRMASTFQENEEDYDGSAQGRLNAWRFAFNYANDNILGGGFDAFTPINFHIYAPDPDLFQDAHSIYFQVLGNFGYIGLIMFIGLSFASWRKAKAIHKECKDDTERIWMSDLAQMLQLSLIAYGVGGAFLGLAYFDLPYHIFAIVCCLEKLREMGPKPKGSVEDEGKINVQTT